MARALPLGLFAAAFLTLCPALGCGVADPGSKADDVPVRVERVVLDSGNAPVVVLGEESGPRWLPIWIGPAEARSIALEIEEHDSPRPNTHDLARSLIQQLEGEVVQVAVTELRDHTYYAEITLRSGGRLVEVDSRPSDAIAIALRAGAPIFVRAALFDSAASLPGEEESVPGDDAAPAREI